MRIKNRLFLLICWGLAIGCGNAVTRHSASVKSKKRPLWLEAKPASETYYIGIGHGDKATSENYLQQAKKNALQDIASEIKVQISSTSTLKQIADDKELYEKYEQIIQTTTSDELEGYERVDAWEDEKSYWVYYRLSKAKYHQRKAEKKRYVTEKGLAFFRQAARYESEGNDAQAIASYLRGLVAVSDYLMEPLPVRYEGREIQLATSCYASLQRVLANLSLEADPETVRIPRRVSESRTAITVRALRMDTRTPVAALPLVAAFEKGEGEVLPHYRTDNDGKSRLLLSRIISKDNEQALRVKVDLMRFAVDGSTPRYALVANMMVTPYVDIRLHIQQPVVYVTTAEKRFSQAKSGDTKLRRQIANYLNNQGFIVAKNRAKADLLIAVHTETKKGETRGSLYGAYASATIEAVDLAHKKTLYTGSVDRAKEYSLSYLGADKAAYQRLLERVEENMLPKLLNAIR